MSVERRADDPVAAQGGATSRRAATTGLRRPGAPALGLVARTAPLLCALVTLAGLEAFAGERPSATPVGGPSPAPSGRGTGPSAPTPQPPDRAAQAAPPPAPRVVVTLVVDQLASWLLDAAASELPASGGFARLAREGTWARFALHPHAFTDTAPGHAALYTGRRPPSHGIFANEFVDRVSGERRSILFDADARIVGPAGPLAGKGASLARLRGDTLADALRRARPNAWIVGLSLKDRGMMFGAGRRPDVGLYFDPGAATFVTSSSLGSAVPAWATALVGPEHIRARLSVPWTPLGGPDRGGARRDDAPGEGDFGGYGRTFPHDASKAKDPTRSFRASPAADALLLELALAALDAAPVERSPALLAVSLSGFDYIGHLFGPDSFESRDALRRLDQALGQFLAGLDARVGPEGWAVVLSADHGVAPMPETVASKRPRYCLTKVADRWGRPCVPGRRLIPMELVASLDAAADAVVGEGQWVTDVADPFVYLSNEARALPEPRAAALRAGVLAALRAVPGVTLAFDLRSLAETCAPEAKQSAILRRVCDSIPLGLDADFVAVPAVGSWFDSEYVTGEGAGHGTPYAYDRAVPLIVRAPGRATAGRRLTPEESTTSFVQTAAALLGIPPPEEAAPAPTLLGR